MAIVKHIKSRNANYSAAINYLLFEHDEKTGKKIVDESGRSILRKEFYMDGLNCDPMSFDKECELTNAHFHKNKKREDIKSHHYIISYDPADVTENGLTGERAQAISLDLAKQMFPGYQATLEPKTEKAIKLEKEALAQIKETTKENAHLVSNLHSNLGGLYRINGQLDLAKRHMKMGISLLEQYQLLYTNDSIPQINNYAVLLIEIQEPDLALSALQKLAQIIKEYNSNHCLDYAQVQESLGSICLITANISQAKTHFKKALKIYEDIWADEPELIEEKYQAIQELYPQAGIALAKSILLTKH